MFKLSMLPVKINLTDYRLAFSQVNNPSYQPKPTYTVSKKSFPAAIKLPKLQAVWAWLGLALLLLNWGHFCYGPWL